MATTDGYGVLDQAARAVAYLQRPHSRTELAAFLGLHPRTTHRLLVVLQRLGWVRASHELPRRTPGRPEVAYVAAVRIARRR